MRIIPSIAQVCVVACARSGPSRVRVLVGGPAGAERDGGCAEED